MTQNSEALREKQDLGALRQQLLQSGAIRLLPEHGTDSAYRVKRSPQNIQREGGLASDRNRLALNSQGAEA